jgi:hypothetical protein
MAECKYTAPNDFRAFCEALGETEASMCHHGVKGMHWGDRKYQDYNGRLTALGRQHYGYGAKKKEKETRLKYEHKNKQYRKEVNFLDKYDINNPATRKRIDDAADLGLRALEIVNRGKKNDKAYINALANNSLDKTTVIDSMGYGNDTETKAAIRGAKDWFVYEDQTDGYASVADLVNQGYKKDKVKDIINTMSAIKPDDPYDPLYFEFDMYNGHVKGNKDDFLDACYLIKDARKN